MAGEVTDAQLVRRVQKGEKGAFDALVLKYQHKIVNLVLRYVRDPDQAMDIAQEAFLKAYRALPRFRGDSAFYTWLYRIAVNTAKNHLAAQRRRPMDVELDLQDSEQYDLHPHHLLATATEWKRAPSRADPFTGKSALVMRARRKAIKKSLCSKSAKKTRLQIISTANAALAEDTEIYDRYRSKYRPTQMDLDMDLACAIRSRTIWNLESLKCA